jgi:DNA repair exonuclease SbcCD nuclease subunit
LIEKISKSHILKSLNNKSKIAFIADLHWNLFQKNNKFLYHMESMFYNFVDLCKEEQVDCAVFLGDIFDTKGTVTTDGLLRVNEMLNLLSKTCPIILIPGNHDMAFLHQTNISLPANYKYHENIIVINNLSELKINGYHFLFLPFTHETNKIISDIKPILDFDKRKVILLSHFGVTTFKVHEYASDFVNNSAAQVNINTLKEFNQIFLGHYHGYQSKKNVTYVSAPLQSRHGDELFQHGFVIYDLASNTHKFIKNKETPQFITYELNKQNVKKMLQLKNHYIRIKVNKKVNKELLVTLRHKLMQNNYEVKTLIDIPNEMKLSAIKGWDEIIFHDDETLIINFLLKLEHEKKLTFNKETLLKHLEIELK